MPRHLSRPVSLAETAWVAHARPSDHRISVWSALFPLTEYVHMLKAIQCTALMLIVLPVSFSIHAATEFEVADQTLRKTYEELTRKVSAQGQIKLRRAERTWLTYRDAQCDFLASAKEYYSAQPIAHMACLARLTQHQTRLLEEQLNCKEGDIACGRQ